MESGALLGVLPALCERLLGEPLKMPSVATWWCGEPAALEQVIHKLQWFDHGYYAWVEPDGGLGLTSVATVPLDRAEKEIFEEYKLWRPVSSCVPNGDCSAGVKPAGMAAHNRPAS